MTTYNNILAIDTSSPKLSLALAYRSDRLVRSDNMVEKTHGQVLIKKIDDLLQSAELVIDELQALVVATGPGSFTGLRIGIAAAKGIALALEIPILGVSIYDLFAVRYSENEEVVSLLVPARKGEYYLGSSMMGIVRNLTVVQETELPALLNNQIVYGASFEPQEIIADIILSTSSGRFDYGGSDLINLGRQKLDAGEFSDIVSLEPMYVQKSIAEIRLDERRSKG